MPMRTFELNIRVILYRRLRIRDSYYDVGPYGQGKAQYGQIHQEKQKTSLETQKPTLKSVGPGNGAVFSATEIDVMKSHEENQHKKFYIQNLTQAWEASGLYSVI